MVTTDPKVLIHCRVFMNVHGLEQTFTNGLLAILTAFCKFKQFE